MAEADIPTWAGDLPGVPEDGGEVAWSGPRSWWGGPLDVEGLALGSTAAAGRAIAAVTRRAVSFDSAGAAGWFGSFSALRVDGRPLAAFAPLSGFFRAADGWVRTHANYPHHERALLAALRAGDRDEARAAMRRLPALDIERAAFEAGGLAVAVREPGVFPLAPDDAWIRLTHLGEGRRFEPAPGARPLAGLRVLDLTRVLAGPSATRLLGALGADVLRVDPPHLPEPPDQHLDTGFSKRSAVAAFGDGIEELLPGAHLVVLGYRLDRLAIHGMDPESLRERHPHLAVVSLDAWGEAPGWRGRRGFDSLVQAATGIAHAYGRDTEEGWRPGALPVQALDMATGLGMAAAGIALAASGRSGWAHLSLIGAARELLALGVGPGDPAPLKVPLREIDSDEGRLTYAPPPFRIEGEAVTYSSPPQRYGSAELAWL
ncbi:CoA transferase [Microbacterium sp. Marseille-Q6965]|uniref:CoA transferase n=1 Tax=Microbacterium sp. Marseille-Q6965 TaxID=2965072 RepID=UPI0021B773B8|nr:CoA transferase [Microbacterium sp. Marseille-Q6965]